MSRFDRSSLRFLLVLVLVPLVLAPGPSPEQAQPIPSGAPRIAPGVVRIDTLRTDSDVSEDGTFSQSFELPVLAGQTYSIWLASEDFDTVLFVYDPSGEVVASDDDGYFGTSSALSFTPNAAGSFLVVATSYSVGSIGNFRIFVSTGGTYSPVTDPLPPGPVAASLDASDAVGLETGWQSDYYLLEPTQLGQLVTLTLRSAAIDSLLYVVDSDGRILASDDDSAGGRDARVAFPWTPAPGQSFYAVVTSAEPDQFGGYFIERVDGTPSPLATPPVTAPIEPGEAMPPTAVALPPATTPEPTSPAVEPDANVLALDAHVEGRLDEGDSGGRRAGPVDSYRIAIASELLVQLDARSDELDTYLQVYDELGNLVAEDDDSGRRTNSRVVLELAPGEYVAEVSSFDGESSGTYHLDFSEASLLTEPEEIRLGSEVDSRWTARHPLDDSGHRVAHYTFRAPRDLAATILLRTRPGRTFCSLEMTGERGRFDERSIRIDDGCVIVADVRSGERYELRAIGSREDDDTEYLLAISAQDPALRWESIGLNRDVRGHITWSSPFSEWNAPTAGFTFELGAGDRVSVHIRNTELDARAYVADIDGNLVASSLDSRSLVDGTGLQFRAPHDGWYRLYVTGRQRWFDTFTLRIDRSPGG